jgi:hypothetical protein
MVRKVVQLKRARSPPLDVILSVLRDCERTWSTPDGPSQSLVSGIKNQRIKTATSATDAMLRNTAAPPKLAAMRLKIAVLKKVSIPDAVPIKTLR